MKTFYTSLLLLVSLLSLGESYTVEIKAFVYTPKNITVKVGDEITFINRDAAAHTVTSGEDCTWDGIFDSGLFGKDESWTYTFNTAGNFPYFCSPHCSMTGSVTVDTPTATASGTGEDNSLIIFPNPASGLLTLQMELTEPSDAEIQVLDGIKNLCFKKDQQLSAGKNSVSIDMTELPAGIYYIRVLLNEKKVWLKKLVKF